MSWLLAIATERLERVCGEDPVWACREMLEATRSDALANIAEWAVDRPLRVAAILLVALTVNWLARRSVKRGVRKLGSERVRRRFRAVRARTPASFLETVEASNVRVQQRVGSLSLVLRSVVSFLVWTIAAFLVLAEIGVSLGPLLAGAGVLGVALGFGSQSLVRDFLSGFFILIEDQFGVGDIVDLGEAIGEIESVSLRTTRLRSVEGTVWHVPNGEIRRVGNMSQHFSRALLDLEVAYDTDLDKATRVIERVAREVAKGDPDVLDEPEVWGVESLGPNSVVIRLVVKTQPSEQWRIMRLLRQRLKEAFDAEGIEIPFPQRTVWTRSADPPVGGGADAGEAVE